MKVGQSITGQASMTNHPLYNVWYDMIRRCNNPQRHNYKYYGGKGIVVCDRWQKSFVKFTEDMGDRPNNYELDRIDMDGNYEPNNCRWVTKSVQQSNRHAYSSTGYKGVYKLNGKYQAQLRVKGKSLHLGVYSTPELANNVVQAYL